MASYLCVKMNSSATKSYNIKSSANKPYLRVDTGFIPLTTATATGPKVMVRAGGVNYRLADFITTTTAITTGTSYLTSAKTTSTSYVTDSRASTSDTGYATRASTSATSYATRASTSATTYGTRASTSATTYGTRASTSATTYATRASTSATTYAGSTSTYATIFVSTTSTVGTSTYNGYGVDSTNTKLLDDPRWYVNVMLVSDNRNSLWEFDNTRTTTMNVLDTRYTYPYPRYVSSTVTINQGISFTFSNTNCNNYLSLKGFTRDKYTTSKSGTVNLAVFTINGDCRFAYISISRQSSNKYTLITGRATRSDFSYRTSGTINTNTIDTRYSNVLWIDYQFPGQNDQYVHWDQSTYSSTLWYGVSGWQQLYSTYTKTIVTRYEYSNLIAVSAYRMSLQEGYFVNLERFPKLQFIISSNTTANNSSRYINHFSITSMSLDSSVTNTTYWTSSKATATGYKTRASTSKTGYNTRASTSATGYQTRVSTSATGYQTRSSTSATVYQTRSSTSATTYATRSSQYTSNTSYITQSETYETSYITTSAETTMEE